MKKGLIITIFLILTFLPTINLKSYEPNTNIFKNNYEETLLTIKFDNLYLNKLIEIENLNIREITPVAINNKNYNYTIKTTKNLKEDFINSYSKFLENNNMLETAETIKIKDFKIESIKVLDNIDNINKKLKNINYEVTKWKT